MIRSTLIATVTAAALTLAPLAIAQAAAPGKVGVLPLRAEGELPPNGTETLEAGIGSGLGSTGATVVPASEVQGAAQCADEACLHDAAKQAGVSFLVRPSVRMEGSDYVITVDVIDGPSGQVIHTASDTCDLCGLSEAADKATALAGTLGEHLTAPTSTATINSEPDGASVYIDGQLVGTTPLELELAVGAHEVRVLKDGYLEGARLFELEAGVAMSVDLALDPAGPAEDDDKPRSALWGRVRPVLPWVAIGVGAASLASGIALIAIDEKPVEFTRCSGNDVDFDGNCRFRHNTIIGGVVMTLVGIGGLAAGTALLVIDKRRGKGDDDRRVQLRPTHNGLALRF